MILLASVSNRLQPVRLLRLISTALLKLLKFTSSMVLNSRINAATVAEQCDGGCSLKVLEGLLSAYWCTFQQLLWQHVQMSSETSLSEVLCMHHMVHLGPYTKKRTARAHAVWRSRSATSRLLADFKLSQLINRQIVGVPCKHIVEKGSAAD